MISPELLEILCCPETHQALAELPAVTVEQINARIAAGAAKNRAGELVKDRIDGGLVRADGVVAYPVRNGVPVLLTEEGMELRTLGIS